jgi:integrase
MGVFIRNDSPYYWLYLETTRDKERTDVRIGHTTAQRHDSRKIAEDRYHQRMNELAARLYKLPSAQPAIRFAKYAEPYTTDVIDLRKGGRRERELLKPLVAYFGDRLMTAIDADATRAYMKQRLGPTVSARTVNREIDLLKGMLRDAVPKYLSASPLVGLRRLRVSTPRRRLLTQAEERKILKACEDAQDRAILVLAWDTLTRLGDLLGLQRSDRKGRWIYITDPKNGESYEIPLSPRAVRALDAISGSAPFYFAKFRKAANSRDWPGSVRQRLEYLCREAHVKYGRKQGGITFHWGTRRTGATRMLVKDRVPLPVVQRLGGWKKPDVLLEIYAEAEKRDLLSAVGQFPRRSRSRRKRA